MTRNWVGGTVLTHWRRVIVSPYNYCLNNPIVMIAPDGRATIYSTSNPDEIDFIKITLKKNRLLEIREWLYTPLRKQRPETFFESPEYTSYLFISKLTTDESASCILINPMWSPMFWAKDGQNTDISRLVMQLRRFYMYTGEGTPF